MYDNICRFLAENFSEDLASWILGEAINFSQLNPTELSLEPIRADSLILLKSEKLILHLEFQTQPDTDIPFRMLDYRMRVYRKFPSQEMKQVVIYLKPTTANLPNYFRLTKTVHEFDIIRLWQQSTNSFLNRAGLLPFAILTASDNPEQVLTQVGQKLGTISNIRERNNLAAATEVLAGLLLDKGLIKSILRSEMMRESVIYQEILNEGIEKGLKQGLQQGLEQGLETGLQQGLQQGELKLEATALKLLQEGMSLKKVADLTGITLARLKKLQILNHSEE